MRIKFKKGKQREFLKKVMENISCPSIKELSNRFSVNYQTLKNYHSERRNLQGTFFEDLCFISKIDKSDLDYEILKENYGQVLGGRKSKK